MEDQLEQAINIAWQGRGDAGLRQQAIEYCNEVRNSDDGWQVCLAMVTGEKPRQDATRHFALQVIDNALTRISSDQVGIIRDRLFQHFQSIVQNSQEPEPPHMRNKLCESLAYVFIVSYQSQWTTFFDDLFALMGSAQSEVGNSKAVDMYLRVLKTIHEEIGDNLISRSREMTERNNIIKDLIRDRAMSKLAASWMTILQYYSSAQQQQELLSREIVDSTLKVIGGWVSWIDITLIVNPTYLNLIFNMLADSNQRSSACEALCEIVAKKMKPADKLELIGLLNPGTLIAQLPTNNDDLEFDERVAKLCNIVAMELIRIMDGTMMISSGVNVTQQQVEQSEQLLIEIMPSILGFLSNEYDDTSSQVFQCLGEYLAFIRKEAKKEREKQDFSAYTKNSHGQLIDPPADSTFVPPRRLELLTLMLNKIILKMRYDESTDWTGGEDESESEFLEVRSKLKILQTQIAGIDQDLFREGITTYVNGSLEGNYGKQWQDVELGLYELSCFSEAMRNGSITVIRGVESKATSTLFELFFKMVNSDIISTVNHPSVHLLYMELVERHSNYFIQDNQQHQGSMQRVLEVFVSPLGVHNNNRRVQVRAWYLFYKFIKSVRSVLGDISELIFSSIQSLLVIKAEVPSEQKGGASDSDSEQIEDNSFDSQLYLFEVCGLLFGSVNEDKGQALSSQLLQPIFSDIEQCIQQGPVQSDSQPALQIHHDLMAISTFAKGLDTAITSKQASGKVKQEVKNASNVVLVVLERMPQLSIIRSSARTALSAMVPLLKVDILPEITRLIQALLEGCSHSEMTDFLGFLGQLMHNFKGETGVFEMFESLLSPLVDRLMVSLDQTEKEASTGSTDAVLLKQDLRRAYLQFVFNALNNGMGAIFITEQNTQAFTNVMQSILVYSKDFYDAPSQKLAIATLGKMFAVWGDGVVAAEPPSAQSISASSKEPTHVFALGSKVNGFDDVFIFEQFSGVCWEVMGKQGFNPRDAQIRLSVGEAGALQKAIYDRKGQAYASYLLERYFPMIGLPQDLAQEYTNNLAQLDRKAFKKYFVEFVTRISS